MNQNNTELGTVKKATFYITIVFIVFTILMLLFAGYFAYKKMTLSYDYCQSFGEIDSEIGWTLKKNISSCLTLKNRIRVEVYFDTKIYTDNNGFRVGSEGIQTPLNPILAIGDSWTFGVGVNYNQSYPYFLSRLLKYPAANAGIPAYGSASTYLYSIPLIENLKPLSNLSIFQ